LVVGERTFPALMFNQDTDYYYAASGRLHRTRGVHLPFENGWRLSVVWGTSTYSENRDAWGDDFTEEPTTVEVAALPPAAPRAESEMPPLLGPRGWLCAEQVLALIELVSEYPSSPPYPEWPEQ
jgi:hypothetical protein